MVLKQCLHGQLSSCDSKLGVSFVQCTSNMASLDSAIIHLFNSLNSEMTQNFVSIFMPYHRGFCYTL